MDYPKLIKEWMKYPTRIITLIHLINNEGKNCTDIFKEIKISSRNQYKILKYFKEKDIIYSIYLKDKNKYHITNKVYYLTDKGKLIAGKLKELDLLLSNI